MAKERITISTDSELVDKLVKLALEDGRTLSSYTNKVLTEHCKQTKLKKAGK